MTQNNILGNGSKPDKICFVLSKYEKYDNKEIARNMKNK